QVLAGIFRAILCLPRSATVVTSNCCRIHVGFRFLIIPLLIRCLPDFFLAAVATSKRLVDVELWQPAVRVDVAQLWLVGGESGWMSSLKFFGECRNALRLGQLFGTRIATSISFTPH